jgi:hypothetical protein
MRSRFNHLVRGCFPGEHEAEFDGFYLAAHLFRMRSCVGIEPGAIKSCLRKMGRIVWRRNAEHFVQPNENLNWLVKKRFFVGSRKRRCRNTPSAVGSKSQHCVIDVVSPTGLSLLFGRVFLQQVSVCKAKIVGPHSRLITHHVRLTIVLLSNRIIYLERVPVLLLFFWSVACRDLLEFNAFKCLMKTLICSWNAEDY